MTDSKDPIGEEKTENTRKGSSVRRRDVMKAAGAASVVGAGFAGTASAQEACNVACQAGSGPANCSCALPSDCEFISKTNTGGDEECATVQVPEGTTHIVAKAGRDCIVYDGDFTPGESNEICISKDCQGISHIEFYDCPSCDFSGVTSCLDVFSCCEVSGCVENLPSDCTLEARLYFEESECSYQSETLTTSDPCFSFTDLDCSCTPDKVEFYDGTTEVTHLEEDPGDLTCSVSTSGCS